MNDYKDVPKVSEGKPTVHMMEQGFNELNEAIDRFTSVLDKYEGGGNTKEKSESGEKQIITVAGQWKMAPKKLEYSAKKIHENIERLENLFS